MICAFSRFAVISIAMTAAAPSLLSQTAASTTDLKYQLPPAVMVKMVDAPPTPIISLSPPHGPIPKMGPRMILVEQSSSLPAIADLAEPELRLAGLRFNPKVDAPSRTRYAVALKLLPLPATGAAAAPREIAISGLPAKLHVVNAQWSPDGRHIALVNLNGGAGLELWLVDVAKASATRVPGLRLNEVLTEPISWIDSKSLAVLAIPAQRKEPPRPSDIPNRADRAGERRQRHARTHLRRLAEKPNRRTGL